MSKALRNITIVGLGLLIAGPAFAKWEVKDRPKFAGGGYSVSDDATGRQLTTTFKTKKAAKAAAKLLNKADDVARNNK